MTDTTDPADLAPIILSGPDTAAGVVAGLLADMSWLAGALNGAGVEVPARVEATIDRAVAWLGELHEQRAVDPETGNPGTGTPDPEPEPADESGES
jgi:hypothetical protein